LPRTSHSLARPPHEPRVAPPLRYAIVPSDVAASHPAPASSGFAGDGSSSRLEFRILQHIRRSSSRLPHSFAFPVVPVDESPSCPGFYIFRPCRRWIFELPRISHPSAHPALKLRAAPELCTSGYTCRSVPELPRFLHLPAVPATKIRVTPNLTSFGALGAGTSGFPSAPLFQLRLPVLVASCPASSTFRLCLGLKFSGYPESSFPRRRLMVSRVASVPASSGFTVPASSSYPESCIYGWVNDVFPVILELCILGLPADESSRPIGRCIFLSYSGCTDNIIQA
jgi:hypothetical protein